VQEKSAHFFKKKNCGGPRGDGKMINRHSKPWTIRIKGHPYVTDGDQRFSDLPEVEHFVGKNDIQPDQIEKIEHRKGLNTIITYKVSDFISVSAVRLVLIEKSREKILAKRKESHGKVLFDAHGHLLGTG